MNGCDRRTDPACPCLVARESPCVVRRVTDPVLRALALVRPYGHPLGVVSATGRPGYTAGPCQAPVAAVHREPRQLFRLGQYVEGGAP